MINGSTVSALSNDEHDSQMMVQRISSPHTLYSYTTSISILQFGDQQTFNISYNLST